MWVSEHGIVMRAEGDAADEDGKHHLRIGPQDPKLFEIPAGYHRVGPSRLGAAGGLSA